MKTIKRKLLEFPIDLFHRIEKASKDEGLKVSTWIRMILKREVDKNKKPGE